MLRNKLNMNKSTLLVVCCIGIARSRKIESDRDYQKNKEHKERVEEHKVLWKKERLLSTSNKYIETLDTNTIASFYFANSLIQLISSIEK